MAYIERIAAGARALVTTLTRMHIPEKDRQWIVDVLRRIRPGSPGFFPEGINVLMEIEGDKGGA